MKNIILLIIVFIALPATGAVAKASKDVREAFSAVFVPAVPHRGLENAQAPLEFDKIKTFVVVLADRMIPAERAVMLITPQEYDYRGAVVEGDGVKTRNGAVYTHLPRGTVMAVADDDFSGRTVYTRLISLNKVSSDRKPDMKATRVTVMLGFKFDKSVIENAEMDAIFSTVEKWVKPFSNFQDAVKYSEEIAPMETINTPPKHPQDSDDRSPKDSKKP